MKQSLWAFALFVGFGSVHALSASTICPTTFNTNTDCGYMVTINADGSITGAVVAGANPYDGADDALVGVVNNSAGVFNSSFTLSSSSSDIFGFDGDGICTFIGPGGSEPSSLGSYCTISQASGVDPGDYQGPLNTFSNIMNFNETGTVNIAGLGAGQTTFFSLEGAPADIGGGIIVTGGTPEPSTWLLLAGGLGLVAYLGRRRKSLYS